VTSASSSLDLLDRLAVAYLTLPLAIFLLGWLELWAAIPLTLCLAYALRPLGARAPPGSSSTPGPSTPASPTRRLPTRVQLTVALAVACAWTACGGTGHLVFANADWHLRDAVLHDLVTGRWPLGYGPFEGAQTLLRAPLGFYLPAALIGKAAGLFAAHAAMALWTAAGVTLFLLQVLSKVPSRLGTTLTVAAVIVLFSGFDVIGTLLRVPGSLAHWDFTGHLEWWAYRYQYSSMTTQLFWVPNHALGGWVAIGLLAREPRGGDLEPLLPLVVAAVALWSPLTALGLVPFVLRRMGQSMLRERSGRLLHPRVWVPALAVGLAVSAYLTLDPGRIPRGWTVHWSGGVGAAAADLARQVEFFLLEAGFLGFAMLAIRRSTQVMLALAILLILPVFSFGFWNDFAMRVSIPSLTVLAVAAGFALIEAAPRPSLRIKQAVLIGLLCVGAVTPLQEFARAAVLERWPIDVDATLVDAACGRYLPHYVARLGAQPFLRVLRPPVALRPGVVEAPWCETR
jgi:hypothetical protein